jgi:hypothetical protein
MAKIQSRFLGDLSSGQVTVLEVSRLQTWEQICAGMRFGVLNSGGYKDSKTATMLHHVDW